MKTSIVVKHVMSLLNWVYFVVNGRRVDVLNGTQPQRPAMLIYEMETIEENTGGLSVENVYELSQGQHHSHVSGI